MLSVLVLCVIGQTVDVTIAPGLDRFSNVTVSVLTREIPPVSYTAQRLGDIKREIEEVAEIKVLDPLEVRGMSVTLPAVRFGRQRWVSIPLEAFNEQYGVLLWLRKEVDPWWIDFQTEKRETAYDKAIEEYQAECEEINKKFYSYYSLQAPRLGMGQGGDRLIFDHHTGVMCYLVPVLPEWPSRPDAVPVFDLTQWYNMQLLSPVEAKKP